MSSEKLPVITDELIFALDQIFPNRHPDLSLSDREIWYKAGQRYVVDYLIEQQARQKETMLTESVLENQLCASLVHLPHHLYQSQGQLHLCQRRQLKLQLLAAEEKLQQRLVVVEQLSEDLVQVLYAYLLTGI